MALTSHHNIKRFITVLFALLLFLSSGCAKDEKPKKVSLYKRSSNIKHHSEDPLLDTLQFGFDLRLGPKEEIEIYTPFLKYLEKTTGERFNINFTEKYEETVRNLGLGNTDFAAIGSLSYVIGRREYGIKYLVSGVNREGDARYQSAIITRPDSGIDNIKDLRGRSFAFGSRMSTQGHLIPRKMLEDAGILIDNIDHIYSGSHVNAVKAVLNGEKAAAGIQDTLAKSLESEGKIKILAFSEPYPSSLVAYNGATDRELVEKMRSALLEFEPMGKHKHILFQWNRTEMPLGFISVDEAEIEKIAELAERYGLLN